MSQADALRVPLPDEQMAGTLTILRELATLLNGEYGAPANLVGYNHVSTYPLLVQNQNSGASAPGINVLDNANAVIIQGTKAAVTIGKAATASSTLNVVGNFSVNTNKFTVNATSGNTAVLGDFAVNTNKFTVAASTGNTAVLGDFAVNTNKFTVTASSGNTAVLGDFAVNTNKFTVAASTGNTVVAGTLGVTGDLAVNTNKFTVTASSGNTVVAGTLQVNGNITHDTTLLTTDVTNNKVSIGAATASTGAMFETAGVLRVTSNVGDATAGKGLLLSYNTTGPVARIRSYNAGSATWGLLAVDGDPVHLRYGTTSRFEIGLTGIGFFAAGQSAKQTVTGTRTGTLAQLQTVVANLLSALNTYGLITDSTS